MKSGATNFTAERVEELRNWKPAKKAVSFRIDLDNLQWLQSEGVKGYQKKMNDVLRWARQNGCPLVHS